MNKIIKLGKWEINFNRILNVYRMKEGNKILHKYKYGKDATKFVKELHDKELINIIEYDLFIKFIEEVENNRNTPLIGNNRAVKFFNDK